MQPMIFEAGHPLYHLQHLTVNQQKIGAKARFQFRAYRMLNDPADLGEGEGPSSLGPLEYETVGDIGLTLHQIQDELPDWLNDLLKTGPVDVALCSRFEYNLENYYIPQVDGQCDLVDAYRRNQETAGPDQLAPEQRNLFADFSWYNSGHSFHGYGRECLSRRDWVTYLGNLLLLNTSHNTLVDGRWVGHGLVTGTTALRWSCNQKKYTQLPEFLLKPIITVTEP